MKNINNFDGFLNEGLSAVAVNAAKNTEDAYSFDRYKAGEWAKVAQLLIDKGYTQEDVEDILNSKTMRWMADNANVRENMTAAKFAKVFDAKAEKAADDMIRKELNREPKGGRPGKAMDKISADAGKFNSDLMSLLAKYKGKVSDAEISQTLKDVLTHTVRIK